MSIRAYCRGLSSGVSAILGVAFLTSFAAVLDFANNCLLSKFGSVTLDSQPITAGIFKGSTHLSHNESPFESLFREFSDIMYSGGDFVGETTFMQHDIVLEEDHPVHVRSTPFVACC